MSKKKKIVGTTERPRLVVYRSLRYMHVQLVDDTKNAVLIGLMNKSSKVKTALKDAKTKTDAARIIGKVLADEAGKKKIKKVIFDRNGYIYHGRIKALADGAREGGLEF
jgi:large subunit ribosomal protein L18